jgi:putative tryptophan/tyrosine transport system substrate-binding protein
LASKEHIVRLRALKVRTPEAVMRRRDFITLFGAIAAWPHAAGAQQVRKMPRVGVLWHAGNAEQESDYLPVLTKAFEELGYVEGKSIGLIHRFPAEEPDRFRTYARELVEEKVDAIIAVTPIGAKEAKQATSTIPIVIVLGSDPVGDGLIDSLAHPGGNITGLSIMGVDLSGKRLALLKEAVPTLSRVAIIVDPRDPISQRVVLVYSNAAKSLSLSIQVFDVVAPDDIDSAFVAVAGAGIGAAFIGPGSIMFNERARIGVSARAQKVPTEVVNAQMVKFGPLLSYGQDYPDYFRRAAGYVDKILKGARPADLPVEQPTRFKMVINLKTASMLGLTIPTSLLSVADEVIE